MVDSLLEGLDILFLFIGRVEGDFVSLDFLIGIFVLVNGCAAVIELF